VVGVSVRVMDRVFRADIRPAARKLVALAYANHAHDDGAGSFPGMEALMTETGLRERQVERHKTALVEAGILRRVRAGHRGIVAELAFDLDRLDELAERVSPMTGFPDADDSSMGDNDDRKGVADDVERVSSVTGKGVADDAPNRHQPSRPTTAVAATDTRQPSMNDDSRWRSCFKALADTWERSRGELLRDDERQRVGAGLAQLLDEYPNTTPEDIRRQAERIADESADYPDPPELHPFALLSSWLDAEDDR
jgi:hypothetical protein